MVVLEATSKECADFVHCRAPSTAEETGEGQGAFGVLLSEVLF